MRRRARKAVLPAPDPHWNAAMMRLLKAHLAETAPVKPKRRTQRRAKASA